MKAVIFKGDIDSMTAEELKAEIKERREIVKCDKAQIKAITEARKAVGGNHNDGARIDILKRSVRYHSEIIKEMKKRLAANE